MVSPTANSAGTSVIYPRHPTIAALIDGGSATGSKWGGPQGSAATVTFSFPGTGSLWKAGYDEIQVPVIYLNETQRTQFREAFAAWSSVANIKLVELRESANDVGDIRVAFSEYLNGRAPAWASLPPYTNTRNYPQAGDIWIATTYASQDFEKGTYEYKLALHEIGHALGLQHSFQGSHILPQHQDHYGYTLMSYEMMPQPTVIRVNGSKVSAEYLYPSGPGIFDIQAIQWLYGANTSHATGNNHYRFTPYQPFMQTIWDAGGIDTIDASNMGGVQFINLNAGSFSSIGLVTDPVQWLAPEDRAAAERHRNWIENFNYPAYTGKDNLAIAFGAVIENAIGGAGNDHLMGNAANNRLDGGAGNDTLIGGAGDDALIGGSGVDVAVYSVGRYAYNLGISGNTVFIHGPDGSDSLQTIEQLQFATSSLDISSLTGSAPVNAVYRFYNSAANTHFYTNQINERNAVINDLDSFFFEGVGFYGLTSGEPVWRFYNSDTGTHFYTIDRTERDAIRQTLPQFIFEDQAYSASSTPHAGLSPLYRFYNAGTGAHFYTANEDEKVSILKNQPQFVFEDIAYYINTA